MRKIVHTCLLLAGCAGAVNAQPQRFRFEHFSDADGLPEMSVNAMIQDRLGFLWIGTQRGLVKYDGYRMLRYLPGGENSYGRNHIFALYEDRSGNIWIGTELGLHRFDRATERTAGTFQHSPDDPTSLSANFVRHIHEDRQGNIWLITITAVGQFNSATHLDRLDPRSGSVRRYGYDMDDDASLGPGMIPDNRFGAGDMPRYPFLEDSRGRIWVGTLGGGLHRYDAESDGFVHLRHDPEDSTSLSNDHVTSIAEDPQGRIWVGTRGGLNLLAGDAGIAGTGRNSGFRRYAHDPDDPDGLGNDDIYHLHVDKRGTLWVATRGGLNRLDPVEKERFTRYATARNGPRSPGDASAFVVSEETNGDLWLLAGTGRDTYALAHYDRARDAFAIYRENRTVPGSVIIQNGIESALVDHAGVLWFGTWGGGLNKVARSTQKFHVYRHNASDPNSLSHDEVRPVFEDREGRIWIGTSGGLDRFEKETETFTHFRHDPTDPRSESSDKVWTLCQDREGKLWVGTDGGGLHRLDPETGIFTPFRHDPANPGSLSSNAVDALLLDRQGDLWVGTIGGGLNRLNSGANTGRDARPHFTRYRHDPADSTSLASDEVLQIYEDRSGELWVVTNIGGFQRYDRSLDRFEWVGKLRNSNGIFEDRAGRLWMSTYGNGWHLFDRATNEARQVLPERGLAMKTYIRATEDDHGHLWISTENGLERFDPETEDVRTYDVQDGLPSQWFRWQSAPARSRAGQLWFGTDQGLIVFDPDELEAADNKQVPQLALTGFKIGGDSVSIGQDSPLHQHISLAGEVSLSYSQNDFTIEYAALDFSRPEKNRYKYRLEGYDEDWRDVGTIRQATYTNLSPGDYTFRVVGSNNDGIWNEEGASLRITVLPPWWRTGWAYGLYGLLLIGAMAQAFQLQRRRLRRKAEAEQVRLRAETAEAHARAKEAESERHRIEAEKAHELEVAYHTLKQTQTQLVQSEKMASLGQLTAGIAHEIQNPLNFVNNFAELNAELLKELLERVRSGEIGSADELADELATVRRNGSQIAKHGRRAEAIVKSMMEHAGVGSGERYEVGLNAFLDEYIDITYSGLKARIPTLEVNIERLFDPAIGTVRMSPKEVGRAFVNILNNALEATHARSLQGEPGFGPRVRIESKMGDGNVEIRVSDNGVGVPRSARDKIFEPFFTTKPTGTGTGLGLSLAYEIIVDGHGGSLRVEGEEGQGATFVVGLPG